jgi:hypothetical protein
MKTKDLIKLLATKDPELEVVWFDGDTFQYIEEDDVDDIELTQPCDEEGNAIEEDEQPFQINFLLLNWSSLESFIMEESANEETK